MIQEILKKFRTAPPISAFKLVLLRTTTILFLIGTALLMTIAIISRPWKIELYGANFEIGLFHVCISGFMKGARCFSGLHEENPRAWFITFRWFLLLSTLIGFCAAFFAIIQLIRTTTEALNVFLIPAILSLISGCLSLTGLLMLIGYWEFRHLDRFRMYIIGWKKHQITKDSVHWPNNMAYAACVMFYLNSLLCVYAHFKDVAFMNAFKLNAIREHEEKKGQLITSALEEALDAEKKEEEK